MRRFLGTTTVVVVVLLVVGLVAGGWYYTEQLLPAPVPDEPTYDIEVVATSACTRCTQRPGTVTVAATEDDLVELAQVGFWTASGALELGHVTSTDGDLVTRTAVLVDGQWPEVGDLGTVTPVTYRGDPTEALELPFEEVEVAGPTGVLPAWLVPGDDGDRVGTGTGDTVAVMIHGRGATREELHRALRTVHAAGIDALVVTIRNDPEAPADPDGWGRFGDTEWADLQAAVDHVVEVQRADRLVLVGSSQGGALVLSWLRRGEHVDRAVGIVLDSPLVSMHDTLVLQAQGRGIPDPVIAPLLWSTKALATLRAGMRFDRLEHAAPDVVHEYDVPMLVTHGTDDSSVPFSGSAELAAARPDLVDLEVYDGVEHIRPWNADPERFEARLATFLDEVAGRPAGSRRG